MFLAAGDGSEGVWPKFIFVQVSFFIGQVSWVCVLCDERVREQACLSNVHSTQSKELATNKVDTAAPGCLRVRKR